MSDKVFRGSNFESWVESKNMSKTDLAEKLDVSRQQLYVYFNSADLSSKLVNKITSKLGVAEKEIWPDVIAIWGNSETSSTKKGVNDFVELRNGMIVMITPLVEEYAMAGFLSGYNDQHFLEELPNHSIIVERFHKGKYYSFRVSGESMNDGSLDSIPSGSIVTAREVKKELWNSRFHIHRFKDYVIVHKEGVLVKRIVDHEVETGKITCRSLNADKDIYPDFPINLDECNMILNIVNVSTSR